MKTLAIIILLFISVFVFSQEQTLRGTFRVLDEVGATGLYYGADYSTNGEALGDLWIPPKGWIDAEIAGATGGWDLQDSIGVFNVKSYGATGDGSTDDHAAIQALLTALDAVGPSHIYFPPGIYKLTDQLYTQFPHYFEGAHVANNIDDGFKTVIFQTTDNPCLYIDSISGYPDYIYGRGGEISFIEFRGTNEIGSTNQGGIVFNTNNDWTFYKNAYQYLGGVPIYLGDDYDAIGLYVYRSTIKECWGGVTKSMIYGRSGGNAAHDAIGGIVIDGCHITHNHGHGINLIAGRLTIQDCIIEYNDSCGVLLSPLGSEEINCRSVSTSILRNSFEENEGGEIFIEYRFESGTYNQYHWNVDIHGNKIIGTVGAYTKDRADACITIDRDYTGSSTEFSSALQDIHIGQNFYGGNKPFVDGNDLLNESCRVYIPGMIGDASSDFIGLGYASIDFAGGVSAGSKYVGNATNSGGITASMTVPNLYLVPSSNLDFTADPQIADGLVDGQPLNIHNGHSSNTVKFDDGTGLSLSDDESCTLDPNDILSLKWSSRKSLWIEQSRSPTIGTAAGYWDRTGVLLSPTTAGDDIRLTSTEQIQFGSTNDYIQGTTSVINIYNGGSMAWKFAGGGNHTTYAPILPSGDGTIDLGDNGSYFRNLKINEIQIDNTSTKLTEVTGDLTMSDINTGSKTLGALAGQITLNAQTGTTYTLVLTDAYKLITLSNSGSITLTVPPNSSVAFATGTQISLCQIAAGAVTVAEGSGVTVNSYGSDVILAGQWATATLIKTATDTWLLIGNL